MQEELSVLIQAQYPLIYLVTSEEERAEQTIATIGENVIIRRYVRWELGEEISA